MNNKERYINVEKAISVLRLRSQQLAGMYGDLGGAASGAALLLDKLANEETEDVRPVVRGKWLCEGTKCRIGYNDYEYWNKWRCSCCGYIRTEGWEHTPEGQEPKANLCENCGAKMQEEKNDE